MEFTAIIKDSEKRLNKLKILTNFFDQSQVIAISVRTRVIHDMFEVNKAEEIFLFAYQYTKDYLNSYEVFQIIDECI